MSLLTTFLQIPLLFNSLCVFLRAEIFSAVVTSNKGFRPFCRDCPWRFSNVMFPFHIFTEQYRNPEPNPNKEICSSHIKSISIIPSSRSSYPWITERFPSKPPLRNWGPWSLVRPKLSKHNLLYSHYRSEYNRRVHDLILTNSIFVNQYIAHGSWANSSRNKKLWHHSPPPPASHWTGHKQVCLLPHSPSNWIWWNTFFQYKLKIWYHQLTSYSHPGSWALSQYFLLIQPVSNSIINQTGHSY